VDVDVEASSADSESPAVPESDVDELLELFPESDVESSAVESLEEVPVVSVELLAPVGGAESAPVDVEVAVLLLTVVASPEQSSTPEPSLPVVSVELEELEPVTEEPGSEVEPEEPESEGELEEPESEVEPEEPESEVELEVELEEPPFPVDACPLQAAG